MIASKKLMSWMFVAAAFGTTAAACSDDDSNKTTTTAAAPGGDVASSNPDVVAFCQKADDLAAEFKKVMADPTSGDVNALTTTAGELTAQATALSSASPADAQAVSACLQKMSAAMTGG
ncbi:MAG: hypothetical protein WCC60_15885 [Ilumatobacteraceae bacterium]